MLTRMTVVFGVAAILCCGIARGETPVADWAGWEKYRESVSHPCLAIKPADVARAKENIKRYAWAQKYLAGLLKAADGYAERFTPEYVAGLIDETTPLSTHFTPCPACRDQGTTWHPQGQWKWSQEKAEQIQCELCGTVFPNDKYAETVRVKTTWGKPQTFGFYGGDTFEVYSYKTLRPSFSGCVRARKIMFVGDAVNLLGEAYLLSGEKKYAAACRVALLRLAEVYPHWLVHSGYGEIADLDPRIAADKITALPEDEKVYPPNHADRSLHTGYWSAGRATGVGLEGRWVRQLTEAYDFTVGSGVYSDAQKRKIEKDLLLESTILFMADQKINNKSVTNRAASAMVGMVVGEPGLVRFGVEGFRKTVDEWFLPDGGTPESNAYALMTINGVNDFAIAMKGYSDPAEYRDPAGKRLENLDLFRGKYEKAWAALVDGLRGDLALPNYADARSDTKIGAGYCDLLVANYPEREQYLSLLNAECGEDLKEAAPSVSLYYREPGLEMKKAGPLKLPDVCLPDLRIGHMRTGADGRESLLLLSASHWGAHHHQDSLNLSYWKAGYGELLSDLGYLWDNPMRQMTVRTLAHNTVMLDEQDQRMAEREGTVEFFETNAHVKVMRASSKAYAQAKRYERTSAIIDHGDGKSYVVDFFCVEGGTTQDYVFHGPNDVRGAVTEDCTQKLYDLKNVKQVTSQRIVWHIDDGKNFIAWCLPEPGEKMYIGDGWGQRDSFNQDRGKVLPYVIRRQTGDGTKWFVSVFSTERIVNEVHRIPASNGAMLEVATDGGTDYILCGRGFSVKSKDWRFDHGE
jgi:hypothetical protein